MDNQGRSQAWAWGTEAPPKRNPTPHPNEFQPMKYPGLATEVMEGECDD